MNTKKLADLQPANVFAYFEEICGIPHGSRNTKMISDYLVAFAKEHNLLLADTTALWQQELDHGKSPESLLHNNINHPNDYGHSIYAKALCVHI